MHFKQNLRKRFEKKVQKPLERFPLNNKGRYGIALNETRARMGLRADIEVRPGGKDGQQLLWSQIRLMFREPFLEFWGAFIMVLLGDSVSAQTYLSNKEYGTWINICLGWSCAYMFGIYIAGDSGAYLNPAVTLTNCLFRGLPLRRFPTYAVAQFLGSFCAHGVMYGNYVAAFDQFEGVGNRTLPPNPNSTARIFCTFPAGDFLPRGSQVFSEFLANFVNLFCIFAMRDENGADLKGGGWFVIALFWLNFGMMSSLGWETGSPINPARDVTGRIWLSILGYKDAWSAFNNYSWIPIIIPFVATISGAIVYDMFIYTGESPINKPYMGLGEIARIFRRHNRDRAQDEEQGQATAQGHSQESSGETRYGEERAERNRSSTEVEEVQDKNTPWDQSVKDRSEDTGKDTVQETRERGPRGGSQGGEEDDSLKMHSAQSHGFGEPQSRVSSHKEGSSQDEKHEKLKEKTNKNVDYDRPRQDDSRSQSQQEVSRHKSRQD